MSTPDDAKILIQIAGDVGETREGIRGLKQDVRDIKLQLDQVVTTQECGQKHKEVHDGIKGMRDQLLGEFKRGTNQANPAVTAAMLKSGEPATVQQIEAHLEERRIDKAARRRSVLAAWLGIVSLITGLLVGGVVGAYKFAVFASRLETLVQQGNEEVRAEVKASNRQVQPRRIYLSDPAPDAALAPPKIAPAPPRTRPTKTR
jgi:hypothetical protein